MNSLFKRKINLLKILKNNSFFLFGPRSTGKSFWIKKTLSKDVLYINLLSAGTLLKLEENPEFLEQMMDINNYKLCVIDEIQKIPKLLDEVHRLIEDRDFKFMLTGSSARKLKRNFANLLGGRASQISFFPLCFSEIPQFDLEKHLLFGGIPRIYNSKNPSHQLADYIQLYLEQEIQIEANLRQLGPFQRFLKTAALNSSEMLQYTNISSDAGVPLTTVKEYYRILEDTLIGATLEPWIESKKRKAIQTAKFYFFDNGVQNALLGINTIDRNSDYWGKLFENFILIEIKAYNSYQQKNKKIYYWRSVNKQEVDFIVDPILAIKVKSTKKITEKHLAGLMALREENLIEKFIIISNDPISRLYDGISIIPWQVFIKNLWSGKYF